MWLLDCRATVFFACRYLQIEWDQKKASSEGPRSFDKPTMKGATPGCPQQSNSSDCGIYVLQYIESFFQVCHWHWHCLLTVVSDVFQNCGCIIVFLVVILISEIVNFAQLLLIIVYSFAQKGKFIATHSFNLPRYQYNLSRKSFVFKNLNFHK